MKLSYVYHLFLFSFTVLSLLGCSLPSGDNAAKSAAEGVTLLQMNLTGYTLAEMHLRIKATLPTAGTTTANAIEIYTNADCSGVNVAQSTAAVLAEAGVAATVPMAIKTSFYLKTNTLPTCFYLGDYVFNHQQPAAPIVSSTAPVSPSRQSFTPLLFGQALGYSTLRFFNDPSCANIVGIGTSEDFAIGGILITLPAESESTIFATTQDALGLTSACASVSTYKHSTSGPAAPAFHHVDPVSPSRLVASPQVVGTVAATVLTVKLFKDPVCAQLVVSGDAADFTTTGLTFTVAENTTTSVYAVAYDASLNPSSCTYLTTYSYDTISPVAPSFSSANPASPTRLTIYPRFSGASSTDTALVRFYNSTLCLNMIGSGTKLEFEGTGILVGVQSNAITSVYAMAVDAAGNTSPCTAMSLYKNNTIPPEPPVFGTTDPLSPNNISSAPFISGLASNTTMSLDFYKDEFCSLNIGTGSADEFNTTGIQLTTPNVPASINTTDVYSVATDEEGNKSDCQQITTYGYSTAKAANPNFFQAVPASPSRVSTQPYILGTAPNTVSIVKLFTDNLCTVLVGSASRAAFGTIGIQMTIPVNTKNKIYALSTDIYGNNSDCTYFSEYIHDNMAPAAPTFISSTPASPTRTSATPTLKGDAALTTAGKQLPTTKINFYDSFLCLTKVGSGTIGSYLAGTLQVVLPENNMSNIYGRTVDDAGNLSACTHIVDYLHNAIAPGRPILSLANPATPSYNHITALKGSLSASLSLLPANTISVYRDAACTLLVKTDAAASFTGPGGVTVILPKNAVTSVYAKTIDVVGNESICNKLVDYAHKDTGPLNLAATQNIDGSVTLGWQPDGFANPSAKYILKRALKAGGPYTIIANKISSSSSTDFNTSIGKTYYYVVNATNVTGTTLNSAAVSVTISSAVSVQPIALVANTGSKLVQLSWTGSPQNLYYEVYRATQSGGPYTLVKQKIQAVTYSDESVANESAYFYVVKGINTSGRSEGSNEVAVFTKDLPAPPTILSVTPFQNEKLCPATAGFGVYFNWAAQDYFTSYRLNQNSSTVAVINGNSYAHCLLISSFVTPVPNYAYQYNAYSLRASWGPMNTTTSDSNLVYVSNQKVDVKIEPGNNEIVLKWAGLTYLTGYQIWRSSVSGWPNPSYTQLEADYSGDMYTDSAVTNGSSYYYTVIPNSYFTRAMKGWPSAEVAATPRVMPGSPSGLVASKSETAAPTLSWVAPSYYNKFNIYRATSLGGTYELVGASPMNTFQDTPMEAGFYYYKVAAVWGNVETGFTNIVSYRYGVVDPLKIVISGLQFTLSWIAQTDASTYAILRSTSLDGPFTQIGATTGNTFVNSVTDPVGSELLTTEGYYYKVRATFNDATIGQDSNIVNGILNASSAPQGLSVVSTTTDSVDLMWPRKSSNTNYRVFQSTSIGGPYTLSGNSTTNTFQVTGLTSNTIYYFKVAYSSCSPGCSSDPVSTLVVSPPSPPSAISGSGQVDINWSGVIGALEYDLLRSTDNTNFSVISANAAGGTYADNSVLNGVNYFYKIRVNFSGAYSLTSEASLPVAPGVVPVIPTGVFASDNTTGTTLALSWTGVPGADKYNVYKSSVSGGPWTDLAISASSTFDQFIGGLLPDTKYYFAVSALNGTNESAVSAETAIVTTVQPAAPLATVTGSTISVTWPAVAGASTYDLLRSTDAITFSNLALALGSMSYVDAAVTAGTAYYYKFLPRDLAGTSMSMSLASAGTQTDLPASVFGLKVYDTSPTSVTIDWMPSYSPQVLSYKVWRSTVSGSAFSLLSDVAVPTHKYLDSTVVPGQTYYYVITAVNLYGAESFSSNEISINFSQTLNDLTAINAVNKVSVTWSTDPTAISYEILRSVVSGGPYGPIATIPGNSYLDSAVQNDTTYFYRVRPIYVSGVNPAYSNEANVSVTLRMNLSVPVEMLDQGISSDSVATLFQRSMTVLNPNDYDGTVTYELEVIASNTNVAPHTLTMIDSSSATKASVIIPSSTTSPTRFKVSWTPNVNEDDYYLTMPAVAALESVKIYSAKIWINQTQASRTKLYYPLLASPQGPSLGDLYNPIESVSSLDDAYQVLQNSSMYVRNTTHLKNISDFNAWEFDALVSTNGSTGTLALYNLNTNTPVDNTESVFDQTNMQMVRATFDRDVTQFTKANELHQYRLAMKCIRDCDLGNVNVYKAGLWLRLENLSEAQIFVRSSLGHQNISSTFLAEEARMGLDASLYSNPVFQFVTTAAVMADPAAAGSIDLVSAGSGLGSDSGTGSIVPVPGAALNFTMVDQLVRQETAPISLLTNDRYLTRIQSSAGMIRILDSFLLIQIGL